MDAAAQQARELHGKALEAEQLARRHRARRDDAIRQLRADDPRRWTYDALARAVGCSQELIAVIIKQPSRRPARR